ncbi:sporulation protein SpoOM [Pontibacillus halophilus JSM 076056 = DSM 19796]|uniref:Sporulation protein SpoOM n=1 Tax=Pontibacillus halophilus JSM 076056 = DSM 19796 TaxID=1385510 RepID=A0A0A5GKE7_9BACI|nr:sporulation protein [Pontibacillus halophilus]KGX91630.1 sporulation protein SpoOM [Pontibacillus halophilus JSM 076056 = DSM 19796]
MFKKIMASVGIGAAKVDTQLEKDRYIAGEEVTGKVVLTGGNVEQQINGIKLFLMTEVVREMDDKKFKENQVLQRFNITETFTLGEGENKEIDFSFTLPENTPASFGRLPIWFQTGLDIPNAIDPQDRDHIHVDPSDKIQTVLTAVQHELGFKLRKVEMEYSKRHGIVQEFEFTPGGRYRSLLDELELLFFPKPDGLEIVMQVDRRANGIGGLFAEALEMDESHLRISFSKQDLNEGPEAVARELGRIIDQHS